MSAEFEDVLTNQPVVIDNVCFCSIVLYVRNADMDGRVLVP